MAHYYPLLVVLLMVVSKCKAEPPLSVSASQHEDAALPCFKLSTVDLQDYRVQWIKYSSNTSQTKIIFSWPKKTQDAERLKWLVNKEGWMSLLLTKVQKTDEGVYNCQIYHGWDLILAKNISLKVKDCTQSAVKVASGKSITLKCPDQNSTAERGGVQISWHFLKGGIAHPVDFKRAKINGTLLTIQSADVSDSNWYRCNYTWSTYGAQCCFDIKLLVQDKDVMTTLPTVIPSSAQPETTQNETILGDKEMDRETQSKLIFVVCAVLAIIVVMIAAAVTGLYIQRGRSSPARDQLPEPCEQSLHGYEVVSLPLASIQNCLYDGLDDELYTFNY